MIEAENPFLDAYMKTMERHGIEFRYDEYGNVEVLNKEHAQAVADRLAHDFMEAITVEVIQGTPAIGNFYGDLRYEYPGDGTKRPILGERSRGSHRVERYYEATPELHQDMADAERIFELLDEEKFYDESAEVLRQPWGGKALRGFEPRPAAELAEMERRLEELTAARRTASKEYRELAAEVGKARADRMVADGIAAGLSPQATLTDIAGHIEVLDVHKARMRRLRKGERDPFLMGGEARERVLSLVDTAYKNRLREIAAAIEEMATNWRTLPTMESRDAEWYLREQSDPPGLAKRRKWLREASRRAQSREAPEPQEPLPQIPGSTRSENGLR
jgi:hypothetical protein